MQKHQTSDQVHLAGNREQAATVSTPRMDPLVKARWVAALRSGKYEQGTGALRNMSKQFCCLGVLCDLYAKESGKPWGRHLHWEGVDEFPSFPVCLWAGLAEESPSAKSTRLSVMNDDGLSFAEIADAIEAQL